MNNTNSSAVLENGIFVVRSAYIITFVVQTASFMVFLSNPKKNLSDAIYILWKAYTFADMTFALGIVIGIGNMMRGSNQYTPYLHKIYEPILTVGWFSGLLLQLSLAMYRYVVLRKPVLYYQYSRGPKWYNGTKYCVYACVGIGAALTSPLLIPGVHMNNEWYRPYYYICVWILQSISSAIYFVMGITRMWNVVSKKCGNVEGTSEDTTNLGATERQMKAERNMLIASCTSWFLSLLPFLVVSPPSMPFLRVLLGWLAASNTPFIHLCVNTEYRLAVWKLLTCEKKKSTARVSAIPMSAQPT